MNKKTKDLFVPYGLPKDGKLRADTALQAQQLTKAFINKFMPEIQQTIKQVEAMKAAPPKGVPEK
jgi:hypothetical protein